MQLNGGTNFVLIEEPTALPASPQIGFHVTLQQAPSGGGGFLQGGNQVKFPTEFKAKRTRPVPSKQVKYKAKGAH